MIKPNIDTIPKDDPMLLYAKKVLAGDIPAGRWVYNNCKLIMDDLEHGHKRGLLYSPAHADAAVDFFSTIIIDDQFKAPYQYTPMDWQLYYFRNIYGWYSQDVQGRRFLTVYLETAKGSGKTWMLAMQLLYATCADGSRNKRNIVFAKDYSQAFITFAMALEMISNTPELEPLFTKIQYGVKCTRTHSTLKCMHGKVGGKGGQGHNLHAIGCDELHEHSNTNLLDIYMSGTKRDPNALVTITTNTGQSYESAWGHTRREMEDVLTGALPRGECDRVFPLIYTVDQDDKPLDDKSPYNIWRKANPSLEITPTVPYVEESVHKCRRAPVKRSEVMRLHFGVPSGSEDLLFHMDTWGACEVDELSPVEERRDAPLYIGVDLSIKTDLTAATLLWDMGDRLECEHKIWIPSMRVQDLMEMDKQDYELWIKQGHITTILGREIRYSNVALWFKDLLEDYKVKMVAFDPYRIQYLIEDIEREGINVSRDDVGADLFFAEHMQKEHVNIKPRRNPPKFYMPISIDHVQNVTTNTIFSKEQGETDHPVDYSPILCSKKNPAVTAAALSIRCQRTTEGFASPIKDRKFCRIDPAVTLIMAVGAAMEMRSAPEIDYSRTAVSFDLKKYF